MERLKKKQLEAQFNLSGDEDGAYMKKKKIKKKKQQKDNVRK